MFGGDATELSFFMNLENTDATLHNHIEKGHCEARELVCDTHSFDFFLSTSGVAGSQPCA